MQPSLPIPSWLIKTARFCSVPVFLVCCALAIRTAAIRTNDLFHFGRTDRWWCYLTINFTHVSGSLSVYEPGHAPSLGWGPGPFFVHVAALGGTWSISGGIAPTWVEHHFWLFGWNEYFLAGKRIEVDYWIDLRWSPVLFLFASGLILAHWANQYLALRRARRRGLCPTCAYDLRGHHPGDRCPECGTTITRETLPA